jgi:hypothetical protein
MSGLHIQTHYLREAKNLFNVLNGEDNILKKKFLKVNVGLIVLNSEMFSVTKRLQVL